GVFMLPDDSAVSLIQAEYPFDAVHPRFLASATHSFAGNAVGDVNLALGDGGAGIAVTDGRAPANLRPSLGKLGNEARLTPNAIALRAKPLRPIVGARCGGGDGESENKSKDRSNRHSISP